MFGWIMGGLPYRTTLTWRDDGRPTEPVAAAGNGRAVQP